MFYLRAQRHNARCFMYLSKSNHWEKLEWCMVNGIHQMKCRRRIWNRNTESELKRSPKENRLKVWTPRQHSLIRFSFSILLSVCLKHFFSIFTYNSPGIRKLFIYITYTEPFLGTAQEEHTSYKCSDTNFCEILNSYDHWMCHFSFCPVSHHVRYCFVIHIGMLYFADLCFFCLKFPQSDRGGRRNTHIFTTAEFFTLESLHKCFWHPN